MPRARHILILLALLAAPAGLAPAAHAQERGDEPRQQPRMSPGEAAARAQARHGGKVLKVTPAGRGYRVKLLLDDGRVVTVTVGD